MKPTAPLALALCLTVSLSALAQQATAPFTDPANLRGERVNPTDGHELPVDQGTLGLQQLLRKLNTRASILNIVAHPDDEDGGMLTYYSRGQGARVTDLSLTRGEGGQNFMTGDFEDALGLIRTQELLANDRYTGVQQLFGTEVDFGFSKTKEEAFAKWSHDRVLYDAVRAIRLVRPLVITATFVGGVTDGHGQHQVSGEIAQEAFVAAADPNVFPDQIAEGLLPWQALRVYARVPFADVNAKGVFDYATGQYVAPHFVNYVTGKVSTTKPPADITVPEGTPDPLLTPASANAADLPANVAATNTPFSYAQFSRIGLFLQRSQIGKSTRLPTAGIYDSGYTLYGSVLCTDPAKAHPSSLTPKTCHPEQSPTGRPVATQGNAQGPGPKDASANGITNASANGITNASAKGITNASANVISNASANGITNVSANGITDVSANGATYTSPGQRPGFPPAQNPQGLKARYIPAGGAAPRAPVPTTQSTTQPNFFTGIDTSIEGIATLAPAAFSTNQLSAIAHDITTASNHFDPAHPDAIAPDLARALTNLDQLIQYVNAWDGDPTQKANALHELRIKSVQLNDALVLAFGIHLDATAPSVQSNITTNAIPPVHVTIAVVSNTNLSYSHTVVLDDQSRTASRPARLRAIVDYRSEPFPPNGSLEKEISLDPIGTEDITRPYFLRKSIEQPTYDLIDPRLRNAPGSPSALTAVAYINFTGLGPHIGVPLMVARVVHNGPQPISIIPPVSIASAPTATVLPTNQTTANLTATLHTDAAIHANINVQSPHNWSIEAKAAGPNAVNFFLHPTAPLSGPQVFHVTAQTPDHHTYTEGFRTVGYPGLIPTNYYTPATTRVVPVDLKLPSHVRIAYLPGTGDAVPEALASIGLTPTMIKVADLNPTTLAHYDTVILGVRAYTANPDLHGAPSQALLDFARAGGNVLVQYETSGLTSADAPYPLSLGAGEKVVDETAPVQLLSPANPLLTTPNQITTADFNNWIAERGHGFLDSFDPHYTALTETHDPGGPETAVQTPQRGGLITTQVGKGRWTYCAFDLYRQLPEAVPGAFRLFVNLLTPER